MMLLFGSASTRVRKFARLFFRSVGSFVTALESIVRFVCALLVRLGVRPDDNPSKQLEGFIKHLERIEERTNGELSERQMAPWSLGACLSVRFSLGRSSCCSFTRELEFLRR